MREKIPIWEKACLTIEEAAEYSHIGIHKLRDIINEDDSEFALRVGKKVLIKRKQFERYLEKNSVI